MLLAESNIENIILGFIKRSLPEFCLIREICLPVALQKRQQSPAIPLQIIINCPLLPEGKVVEIKEGI